VYGRINRATYWVYLIAVGGAAAAASIFLREGPYFSLIVVLVCPLRLHDLGRTGWFALGIWLVALQVEEQVLPYRPPPLIEAPTGINIVLAAALIVVLVGLGAIPGQPGANKFGPPSRPWLKGQPVGAGQ
jgi:uncharacterized membrane protein YhaH (DUF805 family)